MRLLHLEVRLSNPLPTFFNLEHTLRGIKRVKGDTNPNRKLAVTSDILAPIKFDGLTFSPHLMRPSLPPFLWPFLAFSARQIFARRKNLAPPLRIFPRLGGAILSSTPDLTLVWVNLRRIKTIQYGQRILCVPLPAIPGSVLCPVTALQRLFSLVPAPPRRLLSRMKSASVPR